MLSTALLVAAMAVAQGEGERTFRAYTDFAVGGVWTSTADGVKLEHSYSRVLNNRFVQIDMKGGEEPPGMCLIGVDPETRQCTWWGFDGGGGVGKSIMTQEADGVFVLQGEGRGPKGKNSFKFRAVRVDVDTIKLEVLERVVNGEKLETGTATWTRRR